ncbi:hypothetical protein ACFOEK_16695 [Litoribrevibacter euphylliae]|uniref:DUF1444 family protein n=1 Tax=Litoribrevibacter euphylliae TaxID=1834034 RepID=A0ABV7HLX4_9GAMM
MAELKPNEKVYPLLKAADLSIREHVLSKNLFNTESNDLPIVVYALNDEKNYQILSKYEEGLDVDDIHTQALTNLCEEPYAIEKLNEYSLTASGNDFSSELILCPDFLMKAQASLNAEKIIVSVPRRTVIYAGASNMPEEEFRKFLYLSIYTYQDNSFGNEVISDTFLEFENGKLVSKFTLRKN